MIRSAGVDALGKTRPECCDVDYSIPRRPRLLTAKLPFSSISILYFIVPRRCRLLTVKRPYRNPVPFGLTN